MKVTKIFVVDDEPLFFDGLRMVLEKLPSLKLVGTATSGRDALAQLKKMVPDVVFTDIRMPEMNGIELTRTLLELYPSLPVVGLTFFKDEQLVAQMMHAGARGYLMKPRMHNRLLQAVTCVQAGGLYFCGQSWAAAARLMGTFAKSPYMDSHTPELSETDKTILRMIWDEKTNNEIAEAMHMSPKTVENHRAKLYGISGAQNPVGLAKYALFKGILTAEKGEEGTDGQRD